MKKWIVRAAILLVVLFVVGGVVVFFALNTIVKGGVEKVGPMVTKTNVKLDSAKISPLSGEGQLSGLFVGNPEGYQTPSAITVGDVKVHVNVKSVFSNPVIVDSIEIQNPVITFEGGLRSSNIKQLLDNISSVAGESESKAPSEKPAEGGKKLKVASLTVKDAKVNVSLKGLSGKTASVVIPDIHLTNIGMDQEGVSTAELSRQVVQEILEAALKKLPEIAGDLGGGLQGLGGQATEQTKDAAKGLKNLFKK